MKQLKDRRLETVQLIDDALTMKFDALQYMGRHKEALKCIEECYTLWAMNQMRNPGSIKAALALIQSCLQNGEFEDAKRYADHAMFMINDMADNFIPESQRPSFLAEVSYLLAISTRSLAEAGGIPPGEMQQLGEEAIAHARKAIEIHTQMHGTESKEVSRNMSALADVLNFFNDVDDDQVPRLLEQSIAINKRVEGSSSLNVAIGEQNFGATFGKRADRAYGANDLDRCLANFELALPHFREAVRIYQAVNHADGADSALRQAVHAEAQIRQIKAARASTAAAAATRG